MGSFIYERSRVITMSSEYKKLVPCIYLYKGNAVKDLSDITIIDTNPVKLAKFYGDNNADGLIRSMRRLWIS